jgi:cobalt-zinc-cadmium efflux system membrane fusion protein
MRLFGQAVGCFAFALAVACGAPSAPPAAPKLPEPPAGEVWIAADQVKEANIKVEPIGLQDVDDTILTSGRVAFEDVKVGHVFSPVTGQVVKIMAVVGQKLKKGDPLAAIQSPDIGQASSDLGKANADVAAAERDYRREKELWEKHATSQKDFETAEDTYRKAKAEKDRALQKSVLFRTGNVDTVSQSYTLPAPTDGEVLMRNLSPGAEVQGQYSGTGSPQELFTIGEVDEVWVIADLYELDLSRVHVGAPATVKVVAYPGKLFTGRVDWVSGMLDPVSRTARVRCTFANPDRLLKPEMYATVAISVEMRKALALPKGSVLRLGPETVVFVQQGNSPDGRLRFKKLPVTVDEGEGSQWLPVVTKPDQKEALDPGMKIVTSGSVLLSGML